MRTATLANPALTCLHTVLTGEEAASCLPALVVLRWLMRAVVTSRSSKLMTQPGPGHHQLEVRSCKQCWPVDGSPVKISSLILRYLLVNVEKMQVSIKAGIAECWDGGEMVLLISGQREHGRWCQIQLLIVLSLSVGNILSLPLSTAMSLTR